MSRKIDKSKWGPGPWQNEPDVLEWVDERTKYRCVVLRHPEFGQLNGYVQVPPDHPSHGEDYGSLYNRVDLRVHGGLTFCGKLGESYDGWWFGFDCGHGWDIQPGLKAVLGDLFSLTTDDVTYRDMEYVKQEVANLAQQIQLAGEYLEEAWPMEVEEKVKP